METCAECGKQGDLEAIRRCGGCQAIRYCSKDCQKRHWREHKTQCRKAKDEKTVNGEKDRKEGTDDRKEDAETTAWTSADREVSQDVVAQIGDSSAIQSCKKCGHRGRNMKKCGQCKEVTYCSRDCQRGDWKDHKITCQVDDVITTEGFRQTEQREQAERAARERERAAVQRLFGGHGLSSLLGNVRLNPQPLTWEQARSRANLLYPGAQIVNTFGKLKNDFMFFPNVDNVVAVVKIRGAYPHFFRQGRCLEDRDGKMSYVLFHVPGNPMPYFHYGQLREGNFLCYENAFLHFFLDQTVGFRIDDPSLIHIMEP